MKVAKLIFVIMTGLVVFAIGLSVKAATPTVESILPAGGRLSGDTSVTITGTNFESGATVTIGNATSTDVVVVSATEITCRTPASATTGTKDVVVTNPGAETGTLTDGYIYVNDQYAGGTEDGWSYSESADLTMAGPNITISSAANQIFLVDQSATAVSTITITDNTGAITAVNDLRVRIPSTFNMTWDTSDTTATIGGGASSKVSDSVTYDITNKILILNVTSDFAAGDSITVSGLSFANFSAESSYDNLELDVYNTGVIYTVDDKYIQIKSSTSQPFIGGTEDGWNYGESADVILGTPAVKNVTASQDANGFVNVYYDLYDYEGGSGVIPKVYLLYEVDATLNEELASDDTTAITVSNAANFPNSGTIMLGDEMISYTSKAGNDLTGTITRGANSTTADSHSSGLVVWIEAGTSSGDVGTNVSIGTNKLVIWTAKSDIDGFYSATSQIRISAYDGTPTDKIGNGDSGTYVLDTKDPVSPSIKVDASTQYDSSEASLILSVSDDTMTSGSEGSMMLSLNSDFSGGSWITYNTASTIALATDPDIVYVKFKDAKGNVSSAAQVTTPETPTGAMIQDISNVTVSPEEYRLFLAWDVVAVPPQGSFDHYSILRSTSETGTYSEIGTVSTRTTNYYTDSTAAANTLYYYKVKTVDSLNNVSYRSSAVNGRANGIQDAGEGGGGTDVQAPEISSVSAPAGTIFTTQAAITWTTDELSNSYVDYTSATSTPAVYDNTKSAATYVTSHSVTLTGLTPNTQYYYRVRSTDPSSNEATDDNSGVGFTFTTKSGPQLSNVSASSITNTQATVTWVTNVSSTSYVIYSVNSDLSDSTTYGSSDLVSCVSENQCEHSVSLTGLSQGTLYYFYVTSADSEANTGRDDNSGEYYYFRTTKDLTGPVISQVSAATSAYTSTITWTTDELSTSQVEYGETTSYGTTTSEDSTLTIYHVVKLTGLTERQQYHFRVISKDANNNQTTGSDYTFTPVREADSTNPVITNVQVATATLYTTQATVTWTTDELSDSQVEYSTSPGTYDLSETSTSFVTDHSVVLTGLTPNTTYYYRVKSTDFSDNTATKADTYTFTTKAGPVISNVYVDSVVNNQAVIKWTTDTVSTSKVTYDTSVGFSSPREKEDTALTTAHSVTLTNLYSDVIYYFYVESVDSEGDTAKANNGGSYYYFSTADDQIAPVITEVDSSITATTATITWKTDELATSQVEYGTDTGYGTLTTLDSTLSIYHVVTLTGLKTNTTYHFRVRSKDANDNEAIGEDNTFKPIYTEEQTLVVRREPTVDTTPPVISNIRVKNITQNSSVVVWETDELADSFVEYGTTADYGRTQGEYGSKTSHSVTLSELSVDTTYHFRVKGKDGSGNLGFSDDKTFKTLKEGEIPIEEEEEEEEEEVPSVLSEEEKTIDMIKRASKVFFEQILKALPHNPHLPEIEEKSFMSSISEMASKIVLPAQISGEYPQVERGSDWAKIIWVTDKKANSLVAYALDRDYEPTKPEPYLIEAGDSKAETTIHQVKLIGLTPATVYHYQIRSKPLMGPVSESQDKTFKTLSLSLEISDITFTKITESGAELSWKTNIPSKANVSYIDTKTGEKKEIEQPSFLRENQLKLEKLDSTTTYSVEILVIDETGAEAFSPVLRFSTGIDITPPQITQVVADKAISPRGDRVQTIITWLTDKLSTSQVFYSEGPVPVPPEEMKTSSRDNTLTREHVVVISTFKPGTVYRFYVESEDASGNIARSRDYTTLTPQRKETIFEIIFKNFEQTFSWMKQIRF